MQCDRRRDRLGERVQAPPTRTQSVFVIFMPNFHSSLKRVDIYQTYPLNGTSGTRNFIITELEIFAKESNLSNWILPVHCEIQYSKKKWHNETMKQSGKSARDLLGKSNFTAEGDLFSRI